VENKCDSSDNEIVHAYRTTTEALGLKGPTSVKDHNATAVVADNQQKMYEKYWNLITVNPKIIPLVVIQVNGLNN
jgi:hypothetical protein